MIIQLAPGESVAIEGNVISNPGAENIFVQVPPPPAGYLPMVTLLSVLAVGRPKPRLVPGPFEGNSEIPDDSTAAPLKKT